MFILDTKIFLKIPKRSRDIQMFQILLNISPKFSKTFSKIFSNTPWTSFLGIARKSPYFTRLRVVTQTKANLFLKSMSERVVSEIERLRMTSSSIDFESKLKFIILFQSRCMSDTTLSDIDIKNKMDLVWTTLKIEILELESFFTKYCYLWRITVLR